MNRNEIYDIISSERAYQDTRWNASTTTTAGLHEVGAWLTFMRVYLNEAEEKISRNADPFASDMALDCMRKVVAMGVACFEQHGVPSRIP